MRGKNANGFSDFVLLVFTALVKKCVSINILSNFKQLKKFNYFLSLLKILIETFFICKALYFDHLQYFHRSAEGSVSVFLNVSESEYFSEKLHGHS